MQIAAGKMQKTTALFSILYTIATLFLVYLVFQQLATSREDLKTATEELQTTRGQLLAMTRQQARDKIDLRYSEFNSPRLVYARSKASELYPAPSAHQLKVFQFFETLAKDHEQGIVSTADVWYQFAEPLLLYWGAWRSWVDAMRNEQQDPSLWDGYERLVGKVCEEEGASLLSEPEIRDLLTYEKGLLEQEKEFHQEIGF